MDLLMPMEVARICRTSALLPGTAVSSGSGCSTLMGSPGIGVPAVEVRGVGV